MFKLDLQRALDVASGKLTGRGVGKTTVACLDVVGTLDTTDDGDIYCLIKYYRDFEYIHRLLFDVLNYYQYYVKDISFHNRIFNLQNGRRIVFIRADDEYKMCGLRGWMVDFIDY